MAELDIRPLAPALGAEIRGVNLSEPLDDDTIAAIRAAWLDHLVLVFPDQHLTEKQQVRFAEYLGEPVGSRSMERTDDRAESDTRVMLITNIRDKGKPIGVLPDGELQFHTDSVYLEKPLMGAMLFGEEIPSEGGHTLFVNMYTAYETLPDETKARLDGKRAVNVFDYAVQVKSGKLDRDKVKQAVHPAVRTHPETGRKALYVNRLMTEEFVDMAPDESEALLHELYAHAEQRRFIYEHVWKKGDLLMWDNRCTMHARTDFPAGETRLLRRVGLEGDVPF